MFLKHCQGSGFGLKFTESKLERSKLTAEQDAARAGIKTYFVDDFAVASVVEYTGRYPWLGAQHVNERYSIEHICAHLQNKPAAKVDTTDFLCPVREGRRETKCF